MTSTPFSAQYGPYALVAGGSYGLGAAFAQAPDAAAPPAEAAPPAPPPPTNPPMTGPQVLIQTTMGDIVLQLDSVRAPQSVAHILRQVRSSFYNNSIIYRVEKDFVIQMGSWDANGKGHGWYARPVPLEANHISSVTL